MPSRPFWAERHPVATAAALEPLEVQGLWADAVGVIVERFRGEQPVYGPGSETLFLTMLRRLERFSESVTTMAGADTSGIPGAVDFEVHQEADNDYAVLNRKMTVPASADSLVARSLCYAAHNVQRFHRRLTASGRLLLEKELRERVARWDTFNGEGLTPFPWELMANEFTGWLGSRKALEPPSRQLVLFRPMAGGEIDENFGNRKNVAAVELIGVVQYTGQRGWYFGGSFVWSVPTDGPAGIGALAHLTRWVKVGPVWRDRDGDGARDFGWLLSVDAFDLFAGIPETLKKARDAAAAH